MVHVTVGTGPPVEVQEMSVFPPSEIITVASAEVFGFAICAIAYTVRHIMKALSETILNDLVDFILLYSETSAKPTWG